MLSPWLAAGIVDSAAAWGAYAPPAPWQFAMEFALLLGIGWAQWRFASGWLQSPYLAAAVVAMFGVLPHAPSGFFHVIPFLAGIFFAMIWMLRRLRSTNGWSIAGGTGAALVVVVGVHVLDHYSQRSQTTGQGQTSADQGSSALHESAGGPAIILISVDTLRADAAATMQSVKRLSMRGAVWPRAMSTSSWTLPALASLQTGLMPAAHGAGCLEDGHCQGLSGNVPTLAEELAGAGWQTAAIVANPWAGAGMGFARGFDEFVDPGQPGRRLILAGPQSGPHGQDDARTVDAAIEWLADAPANGFYLWVHLMGPHMPYLHSPIDKMRRLDPVTLRSSYPSSEAQRKEIRDAYAGEVAYTDGQVSRLLDAMSERGLLETAVVVFTSDHGEEFWDHGEVEHGHSHHGEITDVPLVLLAPGVAAGERPGVASLIDVAPTLKSIAGLPSNGVDLRQGVSANRIATAWGGIILRLDCSARDAVARLLDPDCSEDVASMRLFDLSKDPGERLPAVPSESHPLVDVARGIGAPERQDAVPVASDRLRALGYLP